MFRLLAVLAMLSTWVNGAHSSPNDSIKVLPDSSNFVTASLLVSSSAETLYSVFGHVTLRMECPVHHLDYVFTYESDTDVGSFMTFIAGRAASRCVAVPSEIYIGDCRKDGRGLVQYKLNLTHHEKQELWRLLDEDMMAGVYRHFNLLTSNCLSTTINAIQNCLIDDSFEWGPAHHPMTLCDGDYLRYHLHRAPWAEFIYVTFLGIIYDNYSEWEHKLSPDLVIPLLREARLTSKVTNEMRPVVIDEGEILCKETRHLKATPFSPIITFCFLLAITLLVTMAEWRFRMRRMADWFDILLFTAQAFIGAVMLFITFYSELFSSKWNWYLVEFFPVPLIFWLVLRRKVIEATCWLVYSGVLLLFILATPFMGVLDLPHQLITVALLIRSVSHYCRNKQ